MSGWDQELKRRQERDDAFMAQLRAEHRHEMRVTLVSGGLGVALTLVLTAAAVAVWGSTYAVTLTLSGVGFVTALGCIFAAQKIDDWRSR